MIGRDIYYGTNDVIYYRGDNFKLFGENTICGAKVSQCADLFAHKKDEIDRCNKTVVGQTSVHSTSGTILAAMAQKYGYKCIVLVGGSNDNCLFKKNHMMRLAKHYDAEVRNVCGTGMSGPVMHRLRNLCAEKNYFNACYTDNYESVMDTIQIDVGQYMPDEVDNLIIPVGSGVNMAAILLGMKKYNKKAKRIVGCHVGPDRRNKIIEMYNPLYNGPINFEMAPLNTVYSKGCKVFLDDGVQLDELYEAKAHNWMTENINTSKEKTLFWIVGRRPTVSEVNEFIGE